MTKRQLEFLKERIEELSHPQESNKSEWNIAYETGYQQACIQILDMIDKYEKYY